VDIDPDLASLIYVAATTGARRGERCGLRWSDVDLDLATLTIARSISDAGRIVSVKDTKTHQARRLALDPSHGQRAARSPTPGRGKSDRCRHPARPGRVRRVAGADAALPYRPDRVTGAFRTLRDRLGIKGLTFHGLRHFSAKADAVRAGPTATLPTRTSVRRGPGRHQSVTLVRNARLWLVPGPAVGLAPRPGRLLGE
jgi:integrase